MLLLCATVKTCRFADGRLLVDARQQGSELRSLKSLLGLVRRVQSLIASTSTCWLAAGVLQARAEKLSAAEAAASSRAAAAEQRTEAAAQEAQAALADKQSQLEAVQARVDEQQLERASLQVSTCSCTGCRR